ncbi:MAG: cytochrome c [Chlorobiaceae bacterium]|jgi:cytochrome c|nr:cytochrome c [Chlorobiaceae bacterium]
MKQFFLVIGIGLFFCSSSFAATKPMTGDAIYNKYCSVCHTMNPPPKLAPPLRSIAAMYRGKYSSKKEGVERIAVFIKLPNIKNALAPDAVRKYGLMSRLPISANDIRTIAEWVWDH